MLTLAMGVAPIITTLRLPLLPDILTVHLPCCTMLACECPAFQLPIESLKAPVQAPRWACAFLFPAFAALTFHPLAHLRSMLTLAMGVAPIITTLRLPLLPDILTVHLPCCTMLACECPAFQLPIESLKAPVQAPRWACVLWFNCGGGVLLFPPFCPLKTCLQHFASPTFDEHTFGLNERSIRTRICASIGGIVCTGVGATIVVFVGAVIARAFLTGSFNFVHFPSGSA